MNAITCILFFSARASLTFPPCHRCSASGDTIQVLAGQSHVTADNREDYVRMALRLRLHEFDHQIAAIREVTSPKHRRCSGGLSFTTFISVGSVKGYPLVIPHALYWYRTCRDGLWGE